MVSNFSDPLNEWKYDTMIWQVFFSSDYVFSNFGAKFDDKKLLVKCYIKSCDVLTKFLAQSEFKAVSRNVQSFWVLFTIAYMKLKLPVEQFSRVWWWRSICFLILLFFHFPLLVQISELYSSVFWSSNPNLKFPLFSFS